jgi:predicted ATP-grasp superfamily ATP-dependent carboligase
MPTSAPANPPAVVLGLCAHGLAVARALASRGVAVYALEQDPALPGVRSRTVRVRLVPDINGPGLVQALADPRNEWPQGSLPVLFPTNDNMVRVLAERWPSLSDRYRLSWSGSRERIGRLLEKSALEQHCIARGCDYPASLRFDALSDPAEVATRLGLPVIAKPARPLSSFKVRVITTLDELVALRSMHPDALPFIVQRFVPGGDERIRFCALYLDHGREIARFDGRKLRSRPMGHTTIAEPLRDDSIHEQTLRFFRGLDLSGPVSVEWKLDASGRAWVIEPTVGRTDFWIDVCTANGVNLPWVEYCHQAGLPVPNVAQRHERTWINTERDPGALPWWACQVARRRAPAARPTFPYLSAADFGPVPRATLRAAQRLLRRLSPARGARQRAPADPAFAKGWSDRGRHP